MKKAVVCATLILLCAPFGWAEEPAGAAPSELQIALGETGKMSRAGLTICFDAVLEDSRCPQGALCVRAGNGKVSLVVGLGSCRPTPVILNTMEGPRSVEIYGYEITLVRLEPWKKMGETIDKKSYKVTLKVRPIGA